MLLNEAEPCWESKRMATSTSLERTRECDAPPLDSADAH
jgi:hypothetical protein